ncbi:glycoside hydrolase family 10 protein [Paenibacillus harenae]|uniref:glycoside hydrolase family 10 protein n=1 Tax=Paenibacillus harenae TaxID=306543 RepID=UPI0027925BD9|nr:family 10 glycosylhydrolase [Paenibacillus harenae]MDQ0059284.1 uncharacterized lipoprotein YddW (UPF0748 family) [Paenibacillus harenae]
MKTTHNCKLLLCIVLLLFSVSATAYSEPVPRATASPPTVTLEDGSVYVIDLIDQGNEDGKLSIFTRNSGKATPPSDAYTVEAIITNGIVAATYAGSPRGTYIPSNGYVLSGTGSAAGLVDALRIGESLTPDFPIPVLPSKYFALNGQVVPITQVNNARGAADIVLYEPAFGSSTKTNPWGLEITVEQGIVTLVVAIAQDAGGNWLDNDSRIPAGGYVLSIQADSPYYGILNGTVREGDAIELNIDNESLIQAYKTVYDAFNPKTREDNPGGWDDGSNSPYPGHRGTDQLIIYDSGYGSSTGTNPWGYEVVVNAGGKVVHTGGNNSAIPAGGYVVSGHGVMSDWLSANVSVGSTFKLLPDKKQVLFLFTPESYLDKAEIGIESAEQSLMLAKQQFLDIAYDRIGQQLASVKAELADLREQTEQGDFADFTESFAELGDQIDQAAYMGYESRAVEHRAVWIRPKETSLAQVQEHVAKLRKLNINAIYLETWWNGYTIYPTENPLAAHNPMYAGFDALEAYLDEAKKSGIEVHAWVENFLIGVGSMAGPVRSLKPEWSMISRQGHDYQDVPLYNTQYYFLNPVQPEVRDFVSDVYKELLQTYNVDGLHLDYIRYPDAGDYTNDFGYDPYTRNLFQQKHGVDPIDLHPGDELWSAWVDLRTNTINEFVYRISSEAKRIKPNLRVSAAVWPNYAVGPVFMHQEPKDWLAKNYIDQLFPMSYHPDASSVASDAENSVALAGGKALIAIGVGTNLGLSNEMLLQQIKQSVDVGASGTALFEFESLFGNGYDKALLAGLFSKQAIVPDKDAAASLITIIAEMQRKIKTIYVPNEGMADGKKYDMELEQIEKAWKEKKDGARNSKESINKINTLVNKIDADKDLNDEVKNRMKADLDYLSSILTVHLSKASK